MKHSSSVSEEDVPLKQRVKTKAQTMVKKAKKDVRKNTIPVQAKSKKFVIPRNKKTRELLDMQGLESRDAIEILRKVKQSFYQPDNILNYVFEDVTIVHNSRFNTEFSTKKQEMRQDGYAQKDLEDTFAYLYLDGWHKVRKMAKEGLCIGSSHFSSLGDPKMGVYVSRFPDVVLPILIAARSSKYLMVFKIAKGKLKAVGERTGDGCTLEPTPNYDGHISKSFPFAHNVSLEQAFTSSQYYFYEFADDGDDLHAKRPRQCCPYAVIQFSLTSSQSYHSSLRNVLTQDSSLRNLPIHDSRNASAQVVPLRSEKKSDVPLMKSTVDGRMYSNYSKHGRTLWSGVIKNKENILSSADLICYSSDILPIPIGVHIDIKAKVSLEKLKPLFPFPLFKQLPAFSTKCKAFDQSMMYLYCEIRPREKNNAKLAKLIKFFQQKNLAGVAEYSDSSAHIYVIPTSDFSHELGLTDRHYPNMLHALILKRLPKEDIQSYKKLNKIGADPIAEAAVRRDIRKELRRIEIEKLKQREQSDSFSRTSSEVEMSSSEDRVEVEKADVRSAATGLKVAKEDTIAVVDFGPKAGDGISKDTRDSTDIIQNELPNKECQDVLSPTSTSNNANELLPDTENVLQSKIAVTAEVFKSPPPIQKHATVFDDTFVDNELRTNTVTRHFMDPRLGFKGDQFLLASPTEIEPLSSDSGADTPQPSPALRTNEMSDGVILQSSSVIDGTVECTDPTEIQADKISNDKENVSRLSTRLMALFSQTGKRQPKSSASIETIISPLTSSTSSATSNMSAVTTLPVESGSITTTLTITSNKPETATPPLNILSCTSFASSNFTSAGDSKMSSECIVSFAEGKTKCIDLPNTTTCAPLTSSAALAGNRIYPNENSAYVESSSGSCVDNPETSSGISPVSQQAASFMACTSASYVSSSNVNSATPASTESKTSAQHVHSSERPVYPATTTLRSDGKEPMEIAKQSENLTKFDQSSLATVNTNLKEILSFFRAKTTSLSGTPTISPPMLSAPASTINKNPSDGSSKYDQTPPEYLPEGNHVQQVQTGNNTAASETTQDNGSMDWYDTLDTKPIEDVSKLRSSSQTPVTETCETSVTMSTPRVGNSPPLPTEALPPPPPPPLTSSFSACYTTCTYSNRNKDSLCYPTATERGLYTHSRSYPEDHSNHAQPTFQESSDLYEYGLTLSSDPTSNSELYFCKGNTPSADSSRSSTPVVTLQEKQLNPGSFPQFLPAPTPPPPPPPPPLLRVYNPVGFHQDNYSTTYSTLYPHPYPVMQPIPIVNSTLPEYHYPVSGNAGYTNFPPPLTNDFDSSAGFGYTKQITSLWNETPTISDEGQSLATKHVYQHEYSKQAEISSRNVVDIKSTSKQKQFHENCSTKRSREATTSLKTDNKNGGTSKFPKKKSDHLHVQEDTINRTRVDKDPAIINSGNSSSMLKPVNEDIFSSHALAKQLASSENVPGKMYVKEGSGREQRVDEIDAAQCGTREGKRTEIEINKMEQQKQFKLSGDNRAIGQDKIKVSIPCKEFNVNLEEEDKSFSETNMDHKEVIDQLQEKSRDTKVHVSNVSDVLDNNDETYEEMQLSDGEIPSDESERKSEKDRNQKTGSQSNDDRSNCQSVHTLSEYVENNDETFFEIPPQSTITRTSGFSDQDNEWETESNTDLSKELFTGIKRESITDLRQLIKEKKRKLIAEDSEKRSTSRNRRRVVEIVRRESVVLTDANPKHGKIPDETLQNMTSSDPESDSIPDRIKIVFENRRNMTSPDSKSCYFTPDRTLDEKRGEISSPDIDKKRRSASPDTESRSSSPDWSRNERYHRRRAGSSDDSRTGSGTGSRPSSSAGSRGAVSRTGSRESLQTGIHPQAESSTKRYSPPKRTRMQRETFDKSHEIPRDKAFSQSDRVLGEDYPTHGHRLDDYHSRDEEYSRKSSVDSRRERQRSISPSEKHYSCVSDDSPVPVRFSPARESRYRSRYSIKRYKTRSSSSENGSSRRARHSDRNNNKYSRHNDRPDLDKTAKNQLDLSKAFLSRLIRPDIIERMQGYVYDDLQRTLVENPNCLDKPEPKPFFGGIGELIYAKRDEEEARYQEERNYQTGLETSERAGRSRTGTSSDHHGEGTAAAPKNRVDSQSLGFKTEQNVVQKDVKILDNDFVNVKQLDVAAAREEDGLRTPESMQDNQLRSKHLNKPFIAQFKEKRRRVLLDQLKNLREKEKIGSCAILLAQLEKLKRDVRQLSAAKLRGSHQPCKNIKQKESISHNNSNEVEKTNVTVDQLHNAAGLAGVHVEGQEIIDTLDLGKDDATTHEHALSNPERHETVDVTRKNKDCESTGCDAMSMETKSSNKAVLTTTEKRNEILHKDTSSAFKQDLTEQVDTNVAHYDNPNSVQQSLPTTKLSLDANYTDDDRKFIKKIDRSKKHKPDDIVLAKNSLGMEDHINKDTKKTENENSLVRSWNKEDTEERNRADTKSRKLNIQDVNTSKHESCWPDQTDELATGPNYTDFDFIAHRAKREFKFELLIKSQELFPKQLSGFPIDVKNQPKSTPCPNTQKNGNRTSANASGKLNIEHKGKTSHHDLPVKQPSRNARRQLSEDINLERKLSRVLNTLTKSQLHILQTGSPMARLRGQLRSKSNSTQADSPDV